MAASTRRSGTRGRPPPSGCTLAGLGTSRRAKDQKRSDKRKEEPIEAKSEGIQPRDMVVRPSRRTAILRRPGNWDRHLVLLCHFLWPSHMWAMAGAMERAAGIRRGEARFAAHLDEIASVLGHAGRAAAARAYCTGLLLPGGRKSVEPMAARIEPGRVQARHQSLHHVVAKAEWDDAAALAAVRRLVLPALERHGPVRYWMVDDTGFPKQGEHSVGVTRQYCGQLGKQDNCQVAVSLSVANDHASLPIAYRLYLPETWAGDPEQIGRAHV